LFYLRLSAKLVGSLNSPLISLIFINDFLYNINSLNQNVNFETATENDSVNPYN